MSQPKTDHQLVALKIQHKGGKFSLDCDLAAEDGIKVLTYALQLIGYRNEQIRKQAALTEEDQIDIAIQNIKKQPLKGKE